MYLVGILIFIVILVFLILLGTSLNTFIDFPSILMIILITMPMLMASGLFPDFKRAFKVIMEKTNRFTEEELKRSLLAIQLTTKLVIGSGLFGSLIGGISMAKAITDIRVLAPSISVMLLTTFYAFCFVFLLMPIQAKLKSLLITFENKS